MRENVSGEPLFRLMGITPYLVRKERITEQTNMLRTAFHEDLHVALWLHMSVPLGGTTSEVLANIYELRAYWDIIAKGIR